MQTIIYVILLIPCLMILNDSSPFKELSIIINLTGFVYGGLLYLFYSRTKIGRRLASHVVQQIEKFNSIIEA